MDRHRKTESMESSQPRDTSFPDFHSNAILRSIHRHGDQSAAQGPPGKPSAQALTFTSAVCRAGMHWYAIVTSSATVEYRKILPTPRPCPPPIRKPSKVSCASQPPTSSKPHALMQLLHNFSEPQTSELHDLPSHSLHQVAVLEYEVPIQSSDLAILTGFRSLSNQVNPIPTCPLGEACNSGLIFWW